MVVIPSRLPVKKVFVTTGRDTALKHHRDYNIIAQLFNTLVDLNYRDALCYCMVAYKCPPPPASHPSDNEIIWRQFKFLSRLIIILSWLPVKKVIATSSRDNALKRHRDNTIAQLLNQCCRTAPVCSDWSENSGLDELIFFFFFFFFIFI